MFKYQYPLLNKRNLYPNIESYTLRSKKVDAKLAEKKRDVKVFVLLINHKTF